MYNVYNTYDVYMYLCMYLYNVGTPSVRLAPWTMMGQVVRIGVSCAVPNKNIYIYIYICTYIYIYICIHIYTYTNYTIYINQSPSSWSLIISRQHDVLWNRTMWYRRLWTKTFLLGEPLPCKTVATAPLRPLTCCFSSRCSQGSSYPEECFFTGSGIVYIYIYIYIIWYIYIYMIIYIYIYIYREREISMHIYIYIYIYIYIRALWNTPPLRRP